MNPDEYDNDKLIDFNALLDFQDSILAEKSPINLFEHLKFILHAQKSKLWYNHETQDLLTDAELNSLINSGYDDNQHLLVSKNQELRIFGDIVNFELKLANKLHKLREDVKNFAISTQLQFSVISNGLNSGTAKTNLLIKLFTELSSDLIWCLSLSYDKFQLDLCSNVEIWQKLWVIYFEAQIPIKYNLQKLYLEFKDRTKCKHINYTIEKDPLTIIETKSKVRRIFEYYFLIEGDIVTLNYPSSVMSFYVHQNQFGIEFIKLVSNDSDGSLKLPEEALFILHYKSTQYWTNT